MYLAIQLTLIISNEFPELCSVQLNEQVAYKRGVAGPQKMAPVVIIANMAAL